MRILVTGSAGHLGEALVRHLREATAHEVVSIDVLPSAFTTQVGSISDRSFVRACMQGVDAVLHAATLHKPHVATHSRQAFVDTNITGTLNLLEEAAAARVRAFVFTSTTSAFGDALTPPDGAPATWITESIVPQPKNIYGATKTAAEDLCQLFARNHGLPCVVLRTSRFFPENDDDPQALAALADANIKANEFLHRRVDVADVVSAHLLALERAPQLRFDRFIISATTPFTPADLAELRHDTAAVIARHAPGFEKIYAARGWTAPASIDRVYVNERARRVLGWAPEYDFHRLLRHLERGEDARSELARAVGAKGYHRGRATIGLESPDQPEVLRLIDELDAYQKPLYPAESHHGIDLDALLRPEVLFAVARDGGGRAVGCGAVVLAAGHGELKRMYTLPSQRGQGIARRLLDFLEAQARLRGCTRFALETGYLQPEAIALYTRCGYQRCGPFGDYAEDPNSVFMCKDAR